MISNSPPPSDKRTIRALENLRKDIWSNNSNHLRHSFQLTKEVVLFNLTFERISQFVFQDKKINRSRSDKLTYLYQIEKPLYTKAIGAISAKLLSTIANMPKVVGNLIAEYALEKGDF